MFSSYQLEDLVTPRDCFLTIYEDNSIYQAIKTMKESFHFGAAWQGKQVLIVLNNQDQPVGLLTLKSLFKAVGIKKLEEDTNFKSEYVSWYFIHKSHQEGLAVKKLMRPIKAYSINCLNLAIYKLVSLFNKADFNYLPVFNNGQFIGILEREILFYKIKDKQNYPIIKQAQPLRLFKYIRAFASSVR